MDAPMLTIILARVEKPEFVCLPRRMITLGFALGILPPFIAVKKFVQQRSCRVHHRRLSRALSVGREEDSSSLSHQQQAVATFRAPDSLKCVFVLSPGTDLPVEIRLDPDKCPLGIIGPEPP